jgi:hypothetical protein
MMNTPTIVDTCSNDALRLITRCAQFRQRFPQQSIMAKTTTSKQSKKTAQNGQAGPAESTWQTRARACQDHQRYADILLLPWVKSSMTHDVPSNPNTANTNHSSCPPHPPPANHVHNSSVEEPAHQSQSHSPATERLAINQEDEIARLKGMPHSPLFLLCRTNCGQKQLSAVSKGRFRSKLGRVNRVPSNQFLSQKERGERISTL